MTCRLSSTLKSIRAFTLLELLVSIAVLALLMLLILQLFNSTVVVFTMGNKRMDTDAQARALFDRMNLDIGSMVLRPDVDYYLKGRPAANDQRGNDQIAFYSQVAGYSSGSPSPISLVAYRLNPATQKIERLGKGLQWNGSSSSESPVVFLPIPLASPLPSPMPAIIPDPAWPQAANTAADGDYEASGPQVFRFEYYYVLKGQKDNQGTIRPSILSVTPWYSAAPINHTSVDGLKDVAAIGVAIAVIDPKSQVQVSNAELASLAQSMNDFTSAMSPGDIEEQWQAAITASSLPNVAKSAIRIYSRTFHVDSFDQ